MKLIAVTSCPTGIAHSQMAAANLEQTAERLGHEIRIEVRGAMGTEDELDPEEIRTADAVIIAADTAVPRERFEGLPVVKATVTEAVSDAESLVEEAVEQSEGVADDGPTSTRTDEEGREGTPRGGDPEKGLFRRLRRLFE